MYTSKILSSTLLLASLLWLASASAQEESEPATEPSVEPSITDEAVTIKPSEKEVVNEFRVNGQLYMICVNPTKGRTYCLVDADGDGNLETRKNDLSPDFLIPAWVLKRW